MQSLDKSGLHHYTMTMVGASGAVNEIQERKEKQDNYDDFVFFESKEQPSTKLTAKQLKTNADQSLKALLNRSGMNLGALPSTNREGGKTGNIDDLSGMSMKSLMMEVLMVCMKLAKSSADNKALQQKENTELKYELAKQNAADLGKKLQAQVDFEHKWGWIMPLVDFLLGLLEAVIGAVKAAQAAAEAMAGDEFNAGMDAAAAVAYMTAGFAGMVKGGAEMAEKLGANKDTCEKIEHDAGIVQGVFEGVALCVDLFHLGKVVSAVSDLTAHLKDTIKPLINELLHAFKTGNMQEVERLVKMIAKEVTKDLEKFVKDEIHVVVDQEVTALEKSGLGKYLKPLFDKLGKEAVEKFIEEQIFQHIEGAVKNIVEEITHEIEEKTTKSIGNAVRKRLAVQALKDSALTGAMIASAVGMAGQSLGSGVTGLQKAKVVKEIAKIEAMMNWLMQIMMLNDRRQKDLQEGQKAEMEKITGGIRDMMNVNKEMTNLSVQIASSLA